MKLSAVGTLACCLLSTVLAGCGSDRLSQSSKQLTSEQPSTLVRKSAGKSGTIDGIKNIINGNNAQVNDDLQSLKVQFEQQQQRLEAMNNEQQALQEQLKRQYINLQVIPTANANAGRNKQGTASTAYIAFLEDESQFSEVEDMASKEISIIPNRETSLKLSIPQDAQFIAIKVGLRYTKKRSQLLIPISSIDFDKPLALNIGACDVSIKEGVNPELAPIFATKLKYYQQPLVSCL